MDDDDSMERSPKRPRLSMFSPELSSHDLDHARHNNDMTLKNKWEAIFAKYSRDFSDVGDEINIMTGEIVVNRGHLEAMTTEDDPGQFDGNSLLRFISDAQQNGLHYPGTDQVLQSIETMAENAVQDLSGSESPSEDRNVAENSLVPYDSDSDSLFASGRESSVDSLFLSDETKEALDEVDAPGNDDILAKFGPQMGQEVLQILGQRQQAHIEPAWRIPIPIEPVTRSTPTTRDTPRSVASSSPRAETQRSLWAAAIPERCESVDPLQVDVIHSHRQASEHYSSDGYVDDDRHSPDAQIDELMEEAKSGECIYCHKVYGSKSSVLAHFDRELKKSSRGGSDTLHDYDVLRKVRSRATRRVRLQRLTVGDFKSMVEFHEGAGLSFEEIARSRVLRTRKTGPQLQHIYHQHRTADESLDDTWSHGEHDLMLGLCQNPLTTLATLRRGMKTRTEFEIGNRLANMWMLEIEKARLTKADSEDDLFPG